jgi:hypothetical protein
MTKYAGGYDPKKIGSGGMYGGSTARRPATMGPTPGGYDPAIARQSAAQRKARGDMYTSGRIPANVNATEWLNSMTQPSPSSWPTLPSGGGGGRGGGMGGGGRAAPDFGGVLDLMNRKPHQFQWQDLQHEDYVPPEFYDFNSAIYDRARSGLGEAITADRASGMASYGQGLEELMQYRDPFTGGPQTTNPGRTAAMERMMAAQGTPTSQNHDEFDRGVQADTAFGNLLHVLSAASNQSQGSRVRALQGDQRGFNERLDAEHRGGNLQVDMIEADARRQYEKERWTFGEDVARQNYMARTSNRQYNHAGQQQTAASNTQTNNAFNDANIRAIIDMIASGGAVDPSRYQGA